MSPNLISIGWNPARESAFEPYAALGLQPGRVARVDGQSVLLITANENTRAESSTEMHRNAEAADVFPVTGDWVGFRPRQSHPTDLIETVLERRSTLMRTKQIMKTAVERQVIAANLDFVFIVHAVINVNLRRLEREAAQVASSGAEVVIVLNKSDLFGDMTRLIADIRASVPLVEVHGVSGVTGAGIESLAGYARPDRTVAFIGASGVGKSTLINRLLGREEMDTGAVRQDDQRGRHTTTARHLLPLDGGGALIDTPGIRSLGLSDAELGIEAVFEDIESLALTCRYNDCSHAEEPDCAVRDAVSRGELDESRLSSFQKLSRELEWVESKSNVRLRNARRDVWKARTRRNRQASKAVEENDRSD